MTGPTEAVMNPTIGHAIGSLHLVCARKSAKPCSELQATLADARNTSDASILLMQSKFKASKRDFIIAGLGAVLGGGAMYFYDTCELRPGSCVTSARIFIP